MQVFVTSQGLWDELGNAVLLKSLLAATAGIQMTSVAFIESHFGCKRHVVQFRVPTDRANIGSTQAERSP